MSVTADHKEFSGIYERSVDEKGRLYLPTHFKKSAEGVQDFVFIVSSRKIVGMPESEFRRITHKIEENFSSALSSFKFTLKCDNTGRFPACRYITEQLSSSKTTRNVIFVGCGAYFEVWKPSHWESEKIKRQKSTEQALDTFLNPAL